MRNDLTDLTVLLDRSGSMAAILADAEGGLNAFVDEQKKLPGRADFTLVQFNTTYDFVHRAVPIRDVPRLTISPAGGTALLDAVARAVQETGDRLKGVPEADRPGLVVFVIVTDGEENSSREFAGPEGLARVRAMIQHQQDVYKWQFTYLGANQDAFAAGQGMGIAVAGLAGYTNKTAGRAYEAAAANVGRMRVAAGLGETVSNRYTDEERRAMSGGGEK